MTPVLLMALMPTGLLLREAAMVLSHDAGTGYLGYLPEVKAWAQTQSGNFAEQVACGARVFDIRVRADGDTVKMHHGDIHIDTTLATALDDALKGAASVPGELVIAGVNHFDGDNAQSLTLDLLKQKNISLIECSETATITYEEALARGKQPNGASLVAMTECWTSNFDDKITCYGPYDEAVQSQPVNAAFLRAHPAPARVAEAVLKCGCYSEGDDQKNAFRMLEAYVNRTVASPSTGSVWNTQIHWQESTRTVVEGNLCFSSLIDDSERSDIHGWILSKIASWPALSFMGINNVCQSGGSGQKLAAACKARNAKAN